MIDFIIAKTLNYLQNTKTYLLERSVLFMCIRMYNVYAEQIQVCVEELYAAITIHNYKHAICPDVTHMTVCKNSTASVKDLHTCTHTEKTTHFKKDPNWLLQFQG